MEKNKERKIFLENLPRKYGIGSLKEVQVIDWKESIGHRVEFIYEGIKGEVEIINYFPKTAHVSIRYLDKEPYKIKTDVFRYCGIGKLLGRHTKEFQIEIGQVLKDDKRDLIILEKEYRRVARDNGNTKDEKWYKYKCNICGWTEGWIEEIHLLNNKGCSCCGSAPKIIVEGINDIPTTAPWMIPYFQGGYDEAKLYTKGSHKKIKPICPDCGRIRDKEIVVKQIYNSHSITCSCGDGVSYPEKTMIGVLEQLNINFKTQFSPDWITPRKYDFYFELNCKSYIIETDGIWHKSDNYMSGQTKEESKEIDDYKDLKARENGIEPIRIDCEVSDLEYIKDKIIHSQLNNLFDLNIIDWSKVEKFALSNLCKSVCELKNTNENLTVLDMIKLVKLSGTTITRYLKNGTKLGWCNYNPKEEQRKAIYKSGKMNGKQVEVFKDGVSLGVFPSCSELERQSEKLFGVKLNNRNISLVANNKKKFYNGYVFKYI